MVVWKTVPGKYKTAIDQFLKAGGPVPAGAKTAGRWHTPGSTFGCHLIEASDLALIAEHVADWGELLEINVYPVIEDTEGEPSRRRYSASSPRDSAKRTVKQAGGRGVPPLARGLVLSRRQVAIKTG